MHRRLGFLLLGGLLVAGACSENNTAPEASSAAPDFLRTGDLAPKHIFPTVAEAWKWQGEARPGGGGGGKGGSTGIFYHGGPIMRTVNVAAVYWSGSTIYSGGPTPGATGTGAQDGSLVGYFLRNIGGSAYFNVNTSYYDGAGVHVPNAVSYTQFYANNTSLPPTNGSGVSNATIQAMLNGAFAAGKLTLDANTIYFVFSGHGVNLGGGFAPYGGNYCAYHTYYSSGGTAVKYAVMPYNLDAGGSCAVYNLSSSPNGDVAADMEVSPMVHEMEEAATDPQLNAWYDRRGQENADKCAYTYGTRYTVNGAQANVNLNGKDFLIQQNWKNVSGGGCALSL